MTEAHGGYGIGEDIRPDVAPPIHRPRAYFEMRRRLEAYDPYFPPPQFDDYDRAPTPYAEPLQDDEVHALERYNIPEEVRRRGIQAEDADELNESDESYEGEDTGRRTPDLTAP